MGSCNSIEPLHNPTNPTNPSNPIAQHIIPLQDNIIGQLCKKCNAHLITYTQYWKSSDPHNVGLYHNQINLIQKCPICDQEQLLYCGM